MERNIRLVVAYDGTDFHGWQDQPGLRTVQGTIQQAVRRVARHQIQVIGSGRTDAGVHAAGQVANFLTTSKIPTEKLKKAIGSRLPKDISIVEASEVSLDFHATGDAVSKLYRYRIHNSPQRPVGRLVQRLTYHFWQPLDVERMRQAARHLVGTMDFSAMASKGSERETMVRTVFRCEVERRYREVQVSVEGGGFLYNQVRNMVGTLIEVGRGHWEPDRLAEIMANRDRANAGPTAPARGLCLCWVRYPPALLVPEAPQPPDEVTQPAGEP
jgi:tRNA pseudouridine38-40 synthase